MWKKCNVVMLPTNIATGICTDKRSESHPKLLLYHTPNWQDGLAVKGKYAQNYHLYILSDEEIKEGDWVYSIKYKMIYKCDEVKGKVYIIPSLGAVAKHEIQKIIATTDSSLSLPSIPSSFISLYIEQYNKGNVIENVEVEYEDKGYQKLMNPEEPLPTKYHWYWQENIVPKINSDNTINIKHVKDSWTREEILQLLIKFKNDLEKPSSIKSWTPIQEWLNLNL